MLRNSMPTVHDQRNNSAFFSWCHVKRRSTRCPPDAHQVSTRCPGVQVCRWCPGGVQVVCRRPGVQVSRCPGVQVFAEAHKRAPGALLFMILQECGAQIIINMPRDDALQVRACVAGIVGILGLGLRPQASCTCSDEKRLRSWRLSAVPSSSLQQQGVGGWRQGKGRRPRCACHMRMSCDITESLDHEG